MPEFKPRTVYVTYIAATPEKVWQALTSSEFTRKYFWDRDIELEPKLGGAFALKLPDGKVNVRGKVIAWDPPRKLSVTWQVEWPEEFRKLPECVVTYEIAKAGEAVRLTMTESHSWNVPEAILSGGRMGWPAILSSLKSLLETGKAPAIQMEPPREMIEAIKKNFSAQRNQRSAALIFSSAAEPGHSSFSLSVLSGAATVLRWLCRSSASAST